MNGYIMQSFEYILCNKKKRLFKIQVSVKKYLPFFV